MEDGLGLNRVILGVDRRCAPLLGVMAGLLSKNWCPWPDSNQHGC
jgi:hypothetical protein